MRECAMMKRGGLDVIVAGLGAHGVHCREHRMDVLAYSVLHLFLPCQASPAHENANRKRKGLKVK
jgi:hypothetical protein